MGAGGKYHRGIGPVGCSGAGSGLKSLEPRATMKLFQRVSGPADQKEIKPKTPSGMGVGGLRRLKGNI
ncbi:hypothetical protein GLOTRDRAFT_134713 [Gloeophyllum trabeum ATCC 11539]|uniref:Uncharacterized protein n=1 Tax=Gloeophyllum trabeum (strain ATCC 11539 / FP-39264 / Madison 617) TaxID=670483 RepID=S7RBD2_GLOTA|nr:uncharacterized protein GLOTRDRAFT_134713 [Gloeophyllum trabeum ATCC 11539]EPQ49709.1 hypothetical protein GLOTRDRAFT_134713 [Gloeophyllum trabeum ATCC 11539]